MHLSHPLLLFLFLFLPDQVALLDETSNILTVSLRGLKSNVKYAEDYVKLSVAQSANTFPTAKVRRKGMKLSSLDNLFSPS